MPKAKKTAELGLPTRNAALIQGLLSEKGISGSFKRYVVLQDNRLIDWTGSWSLSGRGISLDLPPHTKVVHKSNLWRLIGKEAAKRFWCRTTQRSLTRQGKDAFE